MSMDDSRWQEFPVLRQLFEQWRAARGRKPAGSFEKPFRRSWEDLLEDAALVSAEARCEAERDIRILAAAGLVELKTVRYRPYEIDRISIPIDAEARLRAMYADELPVDDEAPFDPTSVEWQTELAFLRHVRVGVRRDDLLRINSFLAVRAADMEPVPIKERSFEIFGDEKRLDALRGTVLFDDGRLTLADLCCFAVAEPLGWQRGSEMAESAIVIENACTWDSYCRWNAKHGFFAAVIYGGGNRFLDSFSRLEGIFNEIGGARRVLYFGDIDPQGLRIPQIASRRAQRQGLPPIEPDFWSYARLLELGVQTTVLIAEPENFDLAYLGWLGASAETARSILERGLRIPQELLGWNYLSRQTRRA
jgi:hypothetical protein